MKGDRWDFEELLALGAMLDSCPPLLGGESVALWMASSLLRVRDRDGTECPLRANAAQRAFEQRRTDRNIVLKARQMGLTTWVAGRFFLKTITHPGMMTVQVAQTKEAAESIFRIVQRFWEWLPAELRQGVLRRSKANAGQMCFGELDSEYRVVSAGDENAGRGLTIQQLHCSEVSRWPGDARATMAGLRAALAPCGEMVVESTPNGAYGCFYEEWIQAGEEQSAVTRHFLPWWMEASYVGTPAHEMTQEELALQARHGLTPGQIGFRRGLEASYRGLRTQEFAETEEDCFLSTGDCCFSVEPLEQRLHEAPEVWQSRRGGALQVWLPAISGRRYLVAVDTAGGGSDGDYAAVQVIDAASGVQCAELQQRLGALELAKVAAELAREYGGALLLVERNNHGSGVLAYLDGVERYRLIYEQDGVAGWLTTAASKPRMISRMGVLLVEEPRLFSSKRLLRECRSFVTWPGGRMGAANGAHDDCLMAMAIAQAVRAEQAGRTGAARG